jgi:hypothetical protein
MPHFSANGQDTAICQKCGSIVTDPSWRPDITGSKGAGNVCKRCESGWDNNKFTHHQKSVVGPIGIYEHCRAESGLEGPALDRYVQRCYGHG